MIRRAQSWLFATAMLAALLAIAPSARASGFGIARFGGEHGSVVATNPTALYYNPAGIGFSTGTQLFLDGELALRSLEWTHRQGQGESPEPAGFEGANYGTASAFNAFGGPMAGASFHLGDFVFGAAAYAPFGGNEHFDRDERFANTQYPGAADGVARWHAYEASTLSIYATIGAAYRIGPLSLGVSGNLILSSISFARAQNPTGVGGLNNLDREGRSKLDAHGVNGSFALGAMVEALPDVLWLAASYQAQPGLGQMQLDGTLDVDADLSTPNDSLVRNVTMHEALPDVFRIGARLRPSSTLELRLSGEFTRWSVLRTQCISLPAEPCTVLPNGEAAPDSGVVVNLRRQLKDTIGVHAGASYWFMPAFEGFAGLGYETAATPDATLDPVLADANNVAIALGARLEVSETWFVALSYTHLQFFERDTTGKSTLADPNIALITRRPDGGGIYKQWVGVIDANVTKTF